MPFKYSLQLEVFNELIQNLHGKFGDLLLKAVINCNLTWPLRKCLETHLVFLFFPTIYVILGCARIRIGAAPSASDSHHTLL